MSTSCSKMRLITTVTFNNPDSSEEPSAEAVSWQLELFMRAGGKQSSALALMVCKELLLTKPFNTSNKINKLIRGRGTRGA